jgi:hypothetical protein
VRSGESTAPSPWDGAYAILTHPTYISKIKYESSISWAHNLFKTQLSSNQVEFSGVSEDRLLAANWQGILDANYQVSEGKYYAGVQSTSPILRYDKATMQ